MMNNTPYTRIGLNSTLMCPGDIMTPWKNQSPGVQDLPEIKLQTLLDAQRTMTIKQSKMRAIMTEELRLEVIRFKAGQLKLGCNENSPQISPGGIVVLDLGTSTPVGCESARHHSEKTKWWRGMPSSGTVHSDHPN